MHDEIERTRQSAVATRDCPTCTWEVVAGAAAVADLEAATHRVQTHASEEERARIGELVEGYRDLLGPLPARLLLLAVWEVLDAPAPPLYLVAVDVDGTWPADTVEAGDVVAERGAAA